MRKKCVIIILFQEGHCVRKSVNLITRCGAMRYNNVPGVECDVAVTVRCDVRDVLLMSAAEEKKEKKKRTQVIGAREPGSRAEMTGLFGLCHSRRSRRRTAGHSGKDGS